MKNYSPKVLITGGSGQLGLALRHHSAASTFDTLFFSHAELDITHLTSIQTAIDQYQPALVINAAAYTAVDKAEKDTLNASLINHIGAENLAITCNTRQIPIIHISTDYVFDGKASTPYQEDEIVNPINVYGKTKWLGEKAIRDYSYQFVIIRVSALFSEFGTNFLKTILNTAKTQNELRIIDDQITCPTYAGDIASAIFSIAKQMRAQKSGKIYHFCSSDSFSWYQFAKRIIAEARIYQQLKVQKIHPISYKEYQTAAKRPPYSVLNCHRIKTDFGIDQPMAKAAIKKVVAHLCRGNNV